MEPIKIPTILALDEGTTNAKAVLVDRDGQIVSVGSTPLSVSHPQPSWAEQDANQILAATLAAISQTLEQLPDADVQAIGISNQRESVLVWDRQTGEALTSVAIWQCRRSEAMCHDLANGPHAKVVQQKSGLPIDPLFPAAKIRWLLDSLPDGIARADKGELCVGTIDSWLVFKLSAGQSFVTDVSNASRTQLFNLHTQSWDAELANIFGVPLACLAQVLPSAAPRGVTKGVAGIADGTPILSQIGDSHAALYGQGGFQRGVIKATYGTGSSLMTPVQTELAEDYRLAHTVAWNDGDLCLALEGNITHSGAAVDYISKLLRLAGPAEVAALADQADSNRGVFFVPALAGLGAPHWASHARGLITGLTDAAGPQHICRAAVEAIAFQVCDVFFLMEQLSGQNLTALLVDGGATKNRSLMQLQADLIQRPVVRSLNSEVSALGAAYLAGKVLGWWPDRATLSALRRDVEVIQPNDNCNDAASNYRAWQQAVQRTLYTL